MAWDYLTRKENQPGIILVGVPHTGHVTTGWAMNILHALGPYVSRINVFTIQNQPIDISRGALVEHALASNAGYVYFLDSDIHTSPETLQRLLNHNVPIISALYYKRREITITEDLMKGFPEGLRENLEIKRKVGMPFFAPAIWKDFKYRDDKGNDVQSFRPVFDGEFTPGQVIEADAIPMGCCLIKTDVFKTLPRPWFYWTFMRDSFMFTQDQSYNIQLNKGMRGCSEDMNFSLLARKHGYRLLCDTSILVRHESQIVVGDRGRSAVMEI